MVISLQSWCWAIPVRCDTTWPQSTGEIFDRCLRCSHELEQFSQKLLEKESGTPIYPWQPTSDTPKLCRFPASLPGKWGELPALPKHFLQFLITSRITLYLYCITAVSLFFKGKECGWSCREKTNSFLSAPAKLVWEILVYLCNFYKYTAKRK